MSVLEKCVEDRSKFEHTVGPESPSHGYNLYYARSQCSRELYKMKERDLHAVHLEVITAYRTLKRIIGVNVLYEISYH
jgi:hypothetical protein